MLTAVMLIIVLFCSTSVYAASGSNVMIGHAASGETGKLSGNKAGDRRGNEVYIEKWTYSSFRFTRYHWKYVLRAKDHDLARALAANMTDICNNDNIGYDTKKPDCTTLYNEAKANGWDISGISKKCETTCSNAVSVCLNKEGIKVPKSWNTKNMKADLLATGEFECFNSKKYYASPDRLVPGDILLYPGKHTAIVVKSDNPFTYILKYLNEKGESKKIRIEEDAAVTFDPNNGTGPRQLTMDEEMDITADKETLDYHSFIGWRKTGKNYFTACYKAERHSLRPGTEKIKIQ